MVWCAELNLVDCNWICSPKLTTHSVYFLKSLITKKTYVGYSVNPIHRLRQHNREIVGGAKGTAKGAPWKIICIVTGFPSETSALQFEWKWHFIRRSKIGRKKGLRIIDCQKGLTYLFNQKWTRNSPDPFSFPLTLIWNSSEGMDIDVNINVNDNGNINVNLLENYVWQNPIKYNSWVVYPVFLKK